MPARHAQLALLAVLSLLGGCRASGSPEALATAPDLLAIEAGRYEDAFAAAVEAGRRAGMTPVLRDLHRGRIETAPTDAASLLEPWHFGTASFEDHVENTVAHQRRRAYFEFAPLDRRRAAEPGEPDLLGIGEPPVDMSEHGGPLGVRVRVYLERAYAPGLRRSTWSRRLSSRAIIVRGREERPRNSFWAPIGRDLEFEARLRMEIAEALEE